MVKKKPVRCRYFDDDGKPIRGVGCNKTDYTCPFVHPSEPMWADLPPVEPGWPTGRRRSSFDRGDRSGPRSPQLLSRISHRPRSRSRGRSPGSSNPRFRSRSPVRKPPVSPTSSRYAPSARPTQNFDPLPDQLRDSRARTDSITSSASLNVIGNPLLSTQPTAPSIQLPRKQTSNPTPPTPAAMHQQLLLPLLPTPPTLLSAKQPSPQSEMSFEEKRKAWAERVQLLSDSLQQRTKLSQLDQEINLIKRLSSFGSSSVIVTGPGKQPLESKLATLDSQREEARKNYDAQLSRVISIDNWPVVAPAENENRESLIKMTKYCEDLRRNAEEINRILSRSISIVPISEAHKDDSTRPLKRARMEEDGQDGEQARQATAEIEELRDRILSMHGTIASIQNDQTAMRNDLVTEYKEYADSKFDEATAGVGKHVESVENKAKALEHSINSTGDDVGELAGDVEHLILANDAFRAEIAETNQKIKDTQARVAQLEQKVYQITQGRSQFVTSVEALKAAHAAYVARPASPPLPPTLPQIDFIVQSIQDSFLEQARAAIKPMLDSMRENIQTLLQERNTEMYQTLWKRLSLTLKLVETISARLTSSYPDGVHPGTT